jgi:hypothetical protein
MGKVYSKLVESFGYIAEAPINQTGYDPEKVQYAYQDGKANPNWPGNKPPAGPDTSDYRDPRGLDNVTNDPVKPTPKKPGMSGNAGTRAFQHWLNSKGIKVAVDGKWGPETAGGNQKYFDTYVVGKKISKEQQDEYEAMRGVGTAHNVRVSPGSGNVYIGSPEYIATMKKYGYDVKTGNPVGGAQSATPGQSGQRKTGALPSKQEDIILNSVEKLEAIFKKYGIQAECAYKDDGSLLTEDDWVLKHINMFSPQEQMEIWKILSEAELTPFGSVGSDIAARRKEAEAQRARAGVSSAYKDSLAAGQRYQQGATAAAQNMPQKQSTLSKFGKNLTNRFGAGGGKRAAAKGVAKLGLRAIPYIGTAVLLWDIGSALYDTFATTEIADLDPADQEIIAREIKNLTDMSKSADYASVSEETKKRVTAILNAANKLAQQAEA